MRKILLIGMGAGALEHLTLQAVAAIRALDVVFLLEKEGAGKAELAALRRAVLERVRPEGGYRVAAATTPERVIREDDYGRGIDDWRRDRGTVLADLVREGMGEHEVGGFLVWGDPCLYDGMIQSLNELNAEGLAMEFDVVTGVSSVAALTAAFRLPLNRIGESITITTARQLKAMPPEAVTNCVVMLDGKAAFCALADTDLEIYWGAYLGTPDEILVHGTVREKADEITRTIERARAAKGWLMDTYLLRRP